MTQVLSPGVYVQEVPSAIQAIAGVGTSTAGFIGYVADDVTMPANPAGGNYNVAPANEARLVTNWSEFKTQFGDISDENRVLANAVYGFFNNGGTRCRVNRVTDLNHPSAFELAVEAITDISEFPASKTHTIVVSQLTLTAPSSSTNYYVRIFNNSSKVLDTAQSSFTPDSTLMGNLDAAITTLPGDPSTLIASIKTASSYSGNLASYTLSASTIEDVAELPTTGTNLVAVRRLGAAYYVRIFNDSSALVYDSLGSSFAPMDDLLTNLMTAIETPPTGTAKTELIQSIATAVSYTIPDATTDFVEQALETFEAIDEIAIVAVPLPPNAIGGINLTRRNAIRMMLLNHCENQKDRFAILDAEETVGQLTQASIYNGGPSSADGYGAVYFPYIKVSGETHYMPPSGHIAGIYARVDATRGVYKAPANEAIRGATGLKYQVSRSQQDGLNPNGINVIRSISGNAVVWGARNIIGDNGRAEYRYVNVRRTLNFLRESIDEGTQFVVFEPNTPALWQQITRNVSDFLTTQWRSGALFGTTPAEAFFVKCDAETNPTAVRALGQVVTEVGVAIVRPAEFVIFRLSQFSAPS